MSIKIGIGQSINTNSLEAGKEATNNAISKLKGEKADIFLVFASSQFNQKELLDGVNSVSQGIKIAGCTTSGELTNEGAFKNSVVVAALKSDKMKFSIGMGDGMDVDDRKAGKDMANQLREQDPNLKMVIMLPDGLAGNGAETIRAIQEEIGEEILLMGGSAGDDLKSVQTYEYFNDKLLTKSIVGLGLSGDFKCGIGIKHGWSAVGIGRKATKIKGNVLYELDGKPAVHLYADYMGESAVEKLKSNPLSAVPEGATHPIGIETGKDKFIVRQPFFAGQDGSLTCATEIPENANIFLMLGDSESVISSIKVAAKEAIEQLGEKPDLVIIFSCAAVSIVLGKNNSAQIEAVKEIIGQDVPIVGFSCYGEQSPLSEDREKSSKKSYFHNETTVVLAIK